MVEWEGRLNTLLPTFLHAAVLATPDAEGVWVDRKEDDRLNRSAENQ